MKLYEISMKERYLSYHIYSILYIQDVYDDIIKKNYAKHYSKTSFTNYP